MPNTITDILEKAALTQWPAAAAEALSLWPSAINPTSAQDYCLAKGFAPCGDNTPAIGAQRSARRGGARVRQGGARRAGTGADARWPWR
jgi:hypothetical protein